MAEEFYRVKRCFMLNHKYIRNREATVQKHFDVVLESAIVPGASNWLLAMPNAGFGQRMNPKEFQAAVSLRLLIPLFPDGATCSSKKCGAPMDRFGYHGLVCKGALARHNLVRDALYDLMNLAGFHPLKDAPVQCLGMKDSSVRHFRPADLLVAGDNHAQDCIDITVVSPIRSRMPAATNVWNAVENAEEEKYKKHSDPCEEANYGFKAFAASVFGVLAHRSDCLLFRVQVAMARFRGYSLPEAASICRNRISVAIQLAVVRHILSRQVVSEVCEPPGFNS
jgi:hypothetical protein